MFTPSTAARHGAADTEGMYSDKDFKALLGAVPVYLDGELKSLLKAQGKKKKLAPLDYENTVVMVKFVCQGLTEALQINLSTGAAGTTQADQNMFYGNKYVDSGVRVDDKTVFCHDAYNKNRWVCPLQVAVNLMLKKYSARAVLVEGIDSPSFLGMMLVH